MANIIKVIFNKHRRNTPVNLSAFEFYVDDVDDESAKVKATKALKQRLESLGARFHTTDELFRYYEAPHTERLDVI
jgi:hypothetical protein